jgi:hypothetical protein
MPKLTAGPTPDGGFISRRTDNEYAYAVAVLDRHERVWARSKAWRARPDVDEYGYGPNPTFGTWVSFSWHSRYDLAAKGVERARSLGCRAVIVPVLD